MSQPLSSRAIWGIVGITLIPISLGASIYLILVPSKVPAIAPTKTQYDTSFIADMKSPDKDKNVYHRTAQLRQVESSTDAQTQYDPSELGKVDITKIGQ